MKYRSTPVVLARAATVQNRAHHEVGCRTYMNWVRLRAVLTGAALMVAGGLPSLVWAPPVHAAPIATVKARTQRMSDANLNSQQQGWYSPGDRLTLVFPSADRPSKATSASTSPTAAGTTCGRAPR